MRDFLYQLKTLAQGETLCYAVGSIVQIHDIKNQSTLREAYAAYESGLATLTQKITGTKTVIKPDGTLDNYHEYRYLATKR